MTFSEGERSLSAYQDIFYPGQVRKLLCFLTIILSLLSNSVNLEKSFILEMTFSLFTKEQ